MAELADALASGASDSNIVEVRVLLTASMISTKDPYIYLAGNVRVFCCGKLEMNSGGVSPGGLMCTMIL
jgi:hypothetical protein